MNAIRNVLQLISVHAKSNIELCYSMSYSFLDTPVKAHVMKLFCFPVGMCIDVILAGATWHSAVMSLICQLITQLVLFRSEQSYKPGHVTISCNEFSHYIQQFFSESLHTPPTR